MKITVTELYKDTMAASQYQHALRFAEAFRNGYDSAKSFNKDMQDYADMAAAYSFGFGGSEVLKFSVEVYDPFVTVSDVVDTLAFERVQRCLFADEVQKVSAELEKTRETLETTRAHAQSEIGALQDEIGTLRATPGLSTADRRDACEVLRDRIQELGELMITALESFDNGDEGASGAFFLFRKERTTLQKLLCALDSTIA